MAGVIRRFAVGSAIGVLVVAGLNVHTFLASYDNPETDGFAVAGWPVNFRSIGGFGVRHRFDSEALLFDTGVLVMIALLAGLISVNMPRLISGRKKQKRSVLQRVGHYLHQLIAPAPPAIAATIIQLQIFFLLSLGMLLILYAMAPIYLEFAGPHGWSFSATPNSRAIDEIERIDAFRRDYRQWDSQVELLAWIAATSILLQIPLLLLWRTDGVDEVV